MFRGIPAIGFCKGHQQATHLGGGASFRQSHLAPPEDCPGSGWGGAEGVERRTGLVTLLNTSN